jgi:hypothetical protein
MNNQRIALAIAAGLGMLAIFMPWVNIPLLGAINGTQIPGGYGWLPFAVFAIPLIIAFLGDRAKPLITNIKYVAAVPGLINAIVAIVEIIKLKQKMKAPDDDLFGQALSSVVSIGFGVYVIIIAGVSVCLISLFAKWFGNYEAPTEKNDGYKKILSLLANKRKQIIISLVSLVLLIGIIGIVFSIVDSRQTIWNGKVNASWYSESKNEFNIKNAEQLAGLAVLVNEGKNFSGKTIKIMRNIVLNDTTDWQKWTENSPTNAWTAIGTKDNSFNGIFDGGGFIVSGVFANKSDNYQGLFGRIVGGTIKNIGVTASYFKGDTAIGGLVGNNEGTVSNSYSSALVTGKYLVGGLTGNSNGEINDSYSTSEVIGDNGVGGFTGINAGTVRGSYFSGTVTGISYVGGFAGSNSGTIDFSHSTGAVNGTDSIGKLNVGGFYIVGGTAIAGGLVGFNDRGSKINNSYSTSAVTGTNIVGGFVGVNSGKVGNSYTIGVVTGRGNFIGGFAGISGGNDSFVSKCYSAGAVTGNGKFVGGFAGTSEMIIDSYYDMQASGQKDKGKSIGKYSGEMQQEITYKKWDFERFWRIKSTVNNGYPHLLDYETVIGILNQKTNLQ